MSNTKQRWLGANIPKPKPDDDEETLNKIEDAELEASFPKGSVGARNRRKGKTFERVVAKELKKVYPEARRGYWQSRLKQSGRGEACDVEGTPWWVECKARKNFSFRQTLEQCLQSKDHRPNLIIFKLDKIANPYAVMRLDELIPVLALAESGNVMPLNKLADFLEKAYRCKNTDELSKVVEEARKHYALKEQIFIEDD